MSAAARRRPSLNRRRSCEYAANMPTTSAVHVVTSPSQQHRHDKEQQAAESDVVPLAVAKILQTADDFGIHNPRDDLVTDFELAADDKGYFAVLYQQGIALRNVIFDGHVMHCIIGVVDAHPDMNVRMRMSCDGWQTQQDLPCKDITSITSQHPGCQFFWVSLGCRNGQVQFAFWSSSASAGTERWDNNFGRNFAVSFQQ